jgi:hypothetical protein
VKSILSRYSLRVFTHQSIRTTYINRFSRCISALDLTGFTYSWGRWRSRLAQTGFSEGLHLCLAPPARSTAYEDKLGRSWYHFSWGPLLRGRMRWHWIGSTLIPLLRHFWFSVGSSSFLDRLFGGGHPYYSWPFCPVHLLSWGFSSSSVFSATYLACMRLGHMEWTKSSFV